MSSDIERRYVLDGGSPEVERLRIQSLALEPAVESLLDEVGVSDGESALDLACGPVGLLRPLSVRVGPQGRVVGLDLDPAEVSAARDHVRKMGLSNVTVVEGDAFHTGFDANSFDVVHARFLIAPVGRAHDLLTEMVRVAKPGGLIIMEEPDSSAWNCYPPSAGFSQLKDVIRECFRLGGSNFDAGPGLFALLHGGGLGQVRTRGVAVPLYDAHPFMRSTAQFATSLRRRILENRLMTESELELAVADVEKAVSRPETWMLSFLVIQAWGTKPGSPPTVR